MEVALKGEASLLWCTSRPSFDERTSPGGLKTCLSCVCANPNAIIKRFLRRSAALPDASAPKARIAIWDLCLADFGWVIGGPLPSALAADWLTSTWDNNAIIYACGPAASLVEKVAGSWVKDVLDLPRDASFAFTTGCQMAHFTSLAAARHAVLRDQGWNAKRDGIIGAPPIRVLANERRRGSIDRAIRYLGLGTGSLVLLATDGKGQVRLEALRAARQMVDGPVIVVLDAVDQKHRRHGPHYRSYTYGKGGLKRGLGSVS